MYGLMCVLVVPLTLNRMIPSTRPSIEHTHTNRRSTPATMSKSNEGVAVLKVLKDAAIKGGLLASAVLGGSSLGGQGAGMPWAQPGTSHIKNFSNDRELSLLITQPETPSPSAAAAVVNLPRCEGGQGEGCEALSEGSEYIKQLQQRSAEKYAERRKQQLVRYNYQNFKASSWLFCFLACRARRVD